VKKPLRLSLKLKVTLLLMATLLLATMAISWVNVRQEQNRTRQELNLYAKTVLSRIIDTILLTGVETARIQPLLVSSGTDPKIKAIIVVDNTFMTKGNSEFQGVGQESETLKRFGYVAVTQSKFSQDMESGHPLLEVVSPIISTQGRIGTALIRIDMYKDMQGAIERSIKNALIMFIILLGVIGMIYFFIGKSIVTPLLTLRESTRRLATGDFEERVVVQSRDEL